MAVIVNKVESILEMKMNANEMVTTFDSLKNTAKQNFKVIADEAVKTGRKLNKSFEDAFSKLNSTEVSTTELSKAYQKINEENQKQLVHSGKMREMSNKYYMDINTGIQTQQRELHKVNELMNTEGISKKQIGFLENQLKAHKSILNALKRAKEISVETPSDVAAGKAKISRAKTLQAVNLANSTVEQNNAKTMIKLYKERVSELRKISALNKSNANNGDSVVDKATKFSNVSDIRGADPKLIRSYDKTIEKIKLLKKQMDGLANVNTLSASQIDNNIAKRSKLNASYKKEVTTLKELKKALEINLQDMPGVQSVEAQINKANKLITNASDQMLKYEAKLKDFDRIIKTADNGYAKSKNVDNARNALNNSDGLSQKYLRDREAVISLSHEILVLEKKLKDENITAREAQAVTTQLKAKTNELTAAMLRNKTAMIKVNKSMADHKDALAEISKVKWVANILKRTMAYTSMYTIIGKVTEALKQSVTYNMEFDKSARTLAAVSNSRGSYNDKLKESMVLEAQLQLLTEKYGDSLENVNKVALELTRAGVSTESILQSSEVVMKLSKLTSDTIEASSGALITYLHVYGQASSVNNNMKLSVEELGNKLAYMANQSKMATSDIATFSNYALSAARAAGASANIVSAMSIALTNAGSSASVAGTGTRKFFQMVTDSSPKVFKMFQNFGVSQKVFAEDMAKGGLEGEQAFTKFLAHIQEMSDKYFIDSIAHMGVRQKEILTKMRVNSAEIIRHIAGTRNAFDTLAGVDLITDSITSSWERFGNAFRKAGGELVSFPFEVLTNFAKFMNGNNGVETFGSIVRVAATALIAFGGALTAVAGYEAIATASTGILSAAFIRLRTIMVATFKNPYLLALTAAITGTVLAVEYFTNKTNEAAQAQQKATADAVKYYRATEDSIKKDIDRTKEQLSLLENRISLTEAERKAKVKLNNTLKEQQGLLAQKKTDNTVSGTKKQMADLEHLIGTYTTYYSLLDSGDKKDKLTTDLKAAITKYKYLVKNLAKIQDDIKSGVATNTQNIMSDADTNAILANLSLVKKYIKNSQVSVLGDLQGIITTSSERLKTSFKQVLKFEPSEVKGSVDTLYTELEKGGKASIQVLSKYLAELTQTVTDKSTPTNLNTYYSKLITQIKATLKIVTSTRDIDANLIKNKEKYLAITMQISTANDKLLHPLQTEISLLRKSVKLAKDKLNTGRTALANAKLLADYTTKSTNLTVATSKFNKEEITSLKAKKMETLKVTQATLSLAIAQQKVNEASGDKSASGKIEDLQRRLNAVNAVIDLKSKELSRALQNELVNMDNLPKVGANAYETLKKQYEVKKKLYKDHKKDLEVLDKWYSKKKQKLDEQRQDVYNKALMKANIELADSAVNLWNDATLSMANSFEDNFFNFIMGKKGAFKNFFSTMATDLVSPYAKSFSKGVTGSLTNFLGVGNNSQQGLRDMGLTLADGVWSGKVDGKDVKIDSSSGSILSGKDNLSKSQLGTVANYASTAKSGYGLLTGGVSSVVYAPATYVANGVTYAYGAGFTGTGDFLAGSAQALSGGDVSALSGTQYAGGLATNAVIGGVGGYALGSIGDSLFGTETQAANYGAIGGTIGSLGGLAGMAIGAALGSIIGGFFGSTKITGQETGIDIYGNATAKHARGQDWAKTEYKNSNWFSSHSWTKFNSSQFNQKEKDAITGVISTYDYLLKELDIVDTKLSVKGGRFSSIQSFLDSNVTRAFIDATGNNSADIYHIWAEYASSIHKKIYEAFATEISKFISDKRNFDVFALNLTGDTLEALSYKSNYLQSDLEMLQNVLGITGVTVDNFAQRFDEAFKQNLTPQTLKDWESLGKALTDAASAAKALRDATLAQYSKEAKYKEYLLSLDSQITQSVIDFKQSLLTTFETLKYSVRDFLDNWYTSGYSSDASYAFYASRYDALKTELNTSLANGDNSSAQRALSSLENVANNLKQSAINTGDNSKLVGVLDGVESDMSNYLALFDNSAEAMKVIIAGDETNISKDSSLQNLTTAIDAYNQAIAAQFGVSTTLSLDSFYTDSSLMQRGDIKAFADILKPKTLEELNKFIGILGNYRWADDKAAYLETLTTADSSKAFSLLDQIGALGNITLPDVLKYYSEGIAGVDYTKNFVNSAGYNFLTSSDIQNASLWDLTGYNLSGGAGTTYSDALQHHNDTYGFTLAQMAKEFTDATDTSNQYDPIYEAFAAAINNIAGTQGNSLEGGGSRIYDPSNSDTWLTEAAVNDALNSIIVDVGNYSYSFADNFPSFTDIQGVTDKFVVVTTSGVGNVWEDLTGLNYLMNLQYTIDAIQAFYDSITSADYGISKDQIPAYADGGIVSSPTVGLIGEAGYPEAVIPMRNGKDIPVNMNNTAVVEKLDDVISVLIQQGNEIKRLRKLTEDAA